MAAWWLISYNFAHWCFERCLKISPASQTCCARRNVTARLVLSDAGTASSRAGVDCQKSLWKAPRPWRSSTTVGENFSVLSATVHASCDLDRNRECGDENVWRGASTSADYLRVTQSKIERIPMAMKVEIIYLITIIDYLKGDSAIRKIVKKVRINKRIVFISSPLVVM